MECQEAEGRLDAYRSGGLSPALRREIKAHLKGCKKCRARLAEMKEAAPPSEPTEAAPSAPAETSPPTVSSEEPPPAAPAPSASPVGRKEFVGLVVILAAIGVGIHLYNQSSVDSKPLSSDNEKPPEAVQPAPETGGSPGAAGAPPAPRSPSSSSAPLMPMKLHRETTQALSKEAERRARLAAAPQVKIVVVSRDVEETADLVEARAVESDGKLLKKKKGETETRLILLLPAHRYDAFFQSLQALGPTQELSKKKPILEDPLEVEVTVE